MSARILFLAAALAAVPATASAQQKVFFCPTTSTSAVGGGGTAADYALENATKAAAKVQTAGISTTTQAGSIGTGSTAAVDAANLWNADIFVSVASNAFDGTAHGTETYFYCTLDAPTVCPPSNGQALATAVQNGMRAQFALPDRGIKRNKTWDVLKRTTMPAVAAFTVFHDCTTGHAALPGGASESAFLRSASGQDLIATGIASGVCSHLGTTCPAATCTPTGPEICDGQDNDCNGQTDENNPGGGQACNTGQPGICATGQTLCQTGSLACIATTSPTTETCNGKDDNCNGQTDENNPGGGSCNTGLPGICAAGDGTCQNGAIVCVQRDQASAESCDGDDNDCNGLIDDGNPGGGGQCQTGNAGVCGVGERRCVSGNLVCMEVNSPSPEVCDGQDNNCDGQTDEGVQSGGDCDTGLKGVCAAGEALCEGGTFTCIQKVQESAESCDGLDNDCNGLIDDISECSTQPDAGLPPPADAGLPVIDVDAGTEEPDAGKPRVLPPTPDAGCGCSAGAEGSALIGLLGLFGLRRRRR